MPCRQYLPVRGKEPDTVYGDTFHRVAEDVPNSPVSTHIVILLEEFVQQGFILAGFFYLLRKSMRGGRSIQRDARPIVIGTPDLIRKPA